MKTVENETKRTETVSPTSQEEITDTTSKSFVSHKCNCQQNQRSKSDHANDKNQQTINKVKALKK